MSAKTDPTDIGMNRTGAQTSPIESKKTLEGAIEGSPTPRFDKTEQIEICLEAAQTFGPVGTMPPPGTVKGAVKTAVDMVKGKSPTVFLDKVAERLAFERTGVRLYEAALIKLEAAGPHAGGPTREDLEEIRDDELAHFQLLVRAMERMGADPTAMTPGADVTAVMSSGLGQAVTDPRVTLSQTLEALLTAELIDNDSWTALAALAEALGHEDLAVDFRGALEEEEEHLARVRTWVLTGLNIEAGVTDEKDVEPTQPEAS